jgi:hypothetical protein
MTTSALPHGFVAKIGRAKEHLSALKLSCDFFTAFGSEAYSLEKESKREAGEYIFRIRVKNKPPIVDWSLMVGDCIHNTRSALDHLFWALVKDKPGAARATFPLFKDWPGFNGLKKANLEQWLTDDALALVEKLQPFNATGGPNKSPLAFLHDFDIMDKHKLLLPAIQFLQSSRIQTFGVGGPKDVADIKVTVTLSGFDDNAELARVLVTPAKDIVDVDITPSFSVVFDGQPGPLYVIPTLERCIEVVETVGNDFTPLL